MKIPSPIYLLLLLISCSACETDLVTGNETEVEEPEIAEPETASDFDILALQLVNETRVNGCRCGGKAFAPATPLSIHTQLNAAALAHSSDMARAQKMAHTGTDGSKVGKRVTRAGYKWRAVAENIGWNYPNIRAMVQGWFDSEGHCKNMMNPAYKEMGIAVQQKYYTMVLGKR